MCHLGVPFVRFLGANWARTVLLVCYEVFNGTREKLAYRIGEFNSCPTRLLRCWSFQPHGRAVIVVMLQNKRVGCTRDVVGMGV